jgi:polysaccharide deacetylase 2 family uncharacterized protein YibQ
MATTQTRHSRRARNILPLLYTAVVLVFVAFGAAIVIVRQNATGLSTPEPSARTSHQPHPVSGEPAKAAERQGPERVIRKHKSRGTLVFVIDDVGYNTWQLKPFLELPFAVTLAVLPGVPYTDEAVRMIESAGKELILHQPMEAIDGSDPGPRAIMTDMGDDAIRQTIRANLAQVHGAAGINNHMGSKATSDTRTMTIVLDEARRAGIYVLDSLTIGDSVIHSVASLMRQTTWERAVFLDNMPDKASILHYINEGTKVAEKRGYAVMIGHVWSAELAQTLSELYPQLIEQGFSLSTISRIMMDKDDDDDLGD